MVIDDAVKLIKGPKGSKVFNYKRVDGNIEEVSITRILSNLKKYMLNQL